MAIIWFIYDGPNDPEGRLAFADLPISECVELLGLRRHAFMKLPEGKTPRFNEDQPRDWWRGPAHVVVQVRSEDERPNGEDWPTGFYELAHTTPKAAAALIPESAKRATFNAPLER